MKLVLVIDGQSANDLFAVGPKDIREYFGPEEWGIRTKDIAKCHFEELQDIDGNIITTRDTFGRLSGGKYKVITHPDNYERKKS